MSDQDDPTAPDSASLENVVVDTAETKTELLVIERSRLLPSFSFRSLFLLTLVGAIVAAIGRAAGLGENGGSVALAGGVIAAIGFLLVVMSALFVVFALAWLVALVTHTNRADDDDDDSDMPPQWVAPRDPVL